MIQGLPQINFDQLQAVAYHFNCTLKYGDDSNLYEKQVKNTIVHQDIVDRITPHKLTRRFPKQRND